MDNRIPVIATGYANEVEVNFSVDPQEYVGWSTQQVQDKLYEMARSINKNANFFRTDFEAPAEAVVEANGSK